MYWWPRGWCSLTFIIACESVGSHTNRYDVTKCHQKIGADFSVQSACSASWKRVACDSNNLLSVPQLKHIKHWWTLDEPGENLTFPMVHNTYTPPLPNSGQIGWAKIFFLMRTRKAAPDGHKWSVAELKYKFSAYCSMARTKKHKRQAAAHARASLHQEENVVSPTEREMDHPQVGTQNDSLDGSIQVRYDSQGCSISGSRLQLETIHIRCVPERLAQYFDKNR